MVSRIIFMGMAYIGLCVSDGFGQTPDVSDLRNGIVTHQHLMAFWDFERHSGGGWSSVGGKDVFHLNDVGNVAHAEDGPLSGGSVLLDGSSAYLSLPHDRSGSLDVQTNRVTVVAWVKWEGGTGFVAGKWNEHDNGGRRQYGLFVSLPYYNGSDQVCGHISQLGGPTDPFPYSIDYSASKQHVPKGEWVCVAFTYDGTYIKSYLNGVFKEREPERIERTAGFLKDKPKGIIQQKNPYFYPYGIGSNRSDFTVGAVVLKSGMGNFFKGKIGGVAVFDDALSEEEMARLAIVPVSAQANHD